MNQARMKMAKTVMEVNRIQSPNLAAMRDALLSKPLNGELRVKPN
jgi:hypothetical protein